MDAAYFNERFVYAAANQFFDLPLDDFLARLFIFRRYSLHSPLGMVCYDFVLPEFANYVLFYFFSFQIFLIKSQPVLRYLKRYCIFRKANTI